MKLKSLFNSLVFSLAVCLPVCGQNASLPYQDSSLPIEQRVSDLLSRMTLEEKVAQMKMKSLNSLRRDGKWDLSKESLDDLFGGESIGCLESPFVEHGVIAQISEAVDRYLRENTRLGIPAIQIAECLHGHLALGTTIFPQSIALGCTWNPDLVGQMASVIAEVAQLYVRDLVSSVTTPVKALKAFEKIYLRRGESRKVVLQIAADDLKLWNQDMQFVLEPGAFELYLGSSSEDIRLQGSFEL